MCVELLTTSMSTKEKVCEGVKNSDVETRLFCYGGYITRKCVFPYQDGPDGGKALVRGCATKGRFFAPFGPGG